MLQKRIVFYVKVAGSSPMHELAIFTLELIDQINYFIDIQRIWAYLIRFYNYISYLNYLQINLWTRLQSIGSFTLVDTTSQ